ncbi:hypothetical protein HanRHA438_Chr08g0358261 [Helianthus annuus]|nr:hypothetical protein HanRHA438_Chr08g0358261 [Helianthus annuus]KAJ0902222.1 hypothetical protein HanPSC8_Chr08g0334431 [Helianthus annuus]
MRYGVGRRRQHHSPPPPLVVIIVALQTFETGTTRQNPHLLLLLHTHTYNSYIYILGSSPISLVSSPLSHPHTHPT